MNTTISQACFEDALKEHELPI